MQGFLDCSPCLGVRAMGADPSAPHPRPGTARSTSRHRNLGAAQCRSGIPVPAGRAMGGESKCLGSSPCLPTPHGAELGLVFMPHHSPPHTLMGIQSQAPAPCLGVHTLRQSESTTAPRRLHPHFSPNPPGQGTSEGAQGRQGGATEAGPDPTGTTVQLRPQQSDPQTCSPGDPFHCPCCFQYPLTWRGY